LAPLFATQNLQAVTDNGATTTNNINIMKLGGQYTNITGAGLAFGTAYNWLNADKTASSNTNASQTQVK
jgi:hypothetical protein